MAKESSVAPKERVNIVYKAATGNAVQDVELPLKILMVGDYTSRTEKPPMDERKPINVDKDNFGQVMAQQDLSLQVSVPNKISDEPGAELSLDLQFKSLKDFEPEGIVGQIEPLQRLLELRAALHALKGPLGNIPAFRKKIQSILSHEATRQQLMEELAQAGSPPALPSDTQTAGES